MSISIDLAFIAIGLATMNLSTKLMNAAIDKAHCKTTYYIAMGMFIGSCVSIIVFIP